MTEIRRVPVLPPRRGESHKGNYGRVLVIAGSRGMSGAAVLCGTAALRGGAGLVTVAGPKIIQDAVAGGFPCYTTAGLPCDEVGRLTSVAINPFLKLMKLADVLAIGPGLGDGDGVARVVRAAMLRITKPVVLDADALNALSPYAAQRVGPTILTPHPGEFARLTGTAMPTTHEARRDAACAFAKQHNVVLVLKGHRTIVADRERYFTNNTGNPGMATGGSGDVLTGLIAALVGQGLSPFDAACLGVHLHGRAGDLAAAAFGEVSMTAIDILAHVPAAMRT